MRTLEKSERARMALNFFWAAVAAAQKSMSDPPPLYVVRTCDSGIQLKSKCDPKQGELVVPAFVRESSSVLLDNQAHKGKTVAVSATVRWERVPDSDEIDLFWGA